MKDHNVYKQQLPLGFTFSFPLKQLGLTKGLLQQWTKGFNCSGVVGEDVVRMLKDALNRRGVSADVIGLFFVFRFHDLPTVMPCHYITFSRCSKGLNPPEGNSWATKRSTEWTDTDMGNLKHMLSNRKRQPIVTPFLAPLRVKEKLTANECRLSHNSIPTSSSPSLARK